MDANLWLDENSPATNPRELTSLSTRSESSMAQIKDWLSSCLSYHERCNVAQHRLPHKHGYAPTRLLDTGDQESDLRLCLSGSLRHTPQYVTLSHCWGGELPCKLLQRNISSFLDRIPARTLPRTFLDAVEVTRRLGKRYLWIDALCIIQDSHEDWLKESATMQLVYSGSFLNLAATASSNGHGGLFRKRDSLKINPCVVGHPLVNKESKRLVLHSHQSHFDNISESALVRRGWVLQELLLAPRIIHFAEGQLFWECNHLTASEILPSGLPQRLIMWHSESKYELIRAIGTKSGASSPDVLQAWITIVEKYCRAQPTFPQDKLVALGALARNVQGQFEVIDRDYFAGLWKYNFLAQLLWFNADGCVSSTPYDEEEGKYIAPSWSWASTRDPIRYELHQCEKYNITFFSELITVEVNGVNDAFGPITSGQATLRGPLCLLKNPMVSESWLPDVDTKNWAVFGSTEIRLDRQVLVWDREPSIDATYCLLYLQGEQSEFDLDKFGLILEAQRSRGRRGIYRRVGVLRPWEDDFDPGEATGHFWTRFPNIVLSSELYEEYDGIGRYTVTII